MKDTKGQYLAKSIILSRKPGAPKDQFKTLLVALFDANDAHKSGKTPLKVLEYLNVEKVRLTKLQVSYYLEGNDLIVNDLSEVNIKQDGALVVIDGKQK
ncbi:MAG TPA: hypothetical protein VJJ79_01385 [Candidatus Nanoarchaeia archaeon]|nr:hypothetical protein [Candidatus Nanoarchaeia archaeon]